MSLLTKSFLNHLFLNHVSIGGGGAITEGESEGKIEAKKEGEMQTTASSDKFFETERTSFGNGTLPNFDSQTMTKSSMITESSTTHTSSKKEYVTSTTSSSLSNKSAGMQPGGGICFKTTSGSTQRSQNGSAPLCQVTFENYFHHFFYFLIFFKLF